MCLHTCVVPLSVVAFKEWAMGCFHGNLYAALIGAFLCPEIRAFTGFWGEISSTVSRVLSDHTLRFKHKNGR